MTTKTKPLTIELPLELHCGCHLTRNDINTVFTFCALHNAAKELLTFARIFLKGEADQVVMEQIALAAIKKAGGENPNVR